MIELNDRALLERRVCYLSSAEHAMYDTVCDKITVLVEVI